MSEIENENLGAIESEAQADELLESVEQSSDGPIQDEAQQAPQTMDEFELTVGGKQIKAKRDQLIQWAQQGYSAPGQLSKLTRELDSYKKKWTEFEPQYKTLQEKYGPVDEYVRQNPQFWDHVLKSYEQRNQVLGDTSNPLAGMVTDLQKQVQDLIQYKNQIEERQVKHQTAQEDQAYLSTLDEMQKAYPDIDFTSPDEEGRSLEYKVLEYAHENGIKNFKTAFRDFYHEELVKRSESKAKEALLKDKQKNTKLGILGVTPTPTKRTETKNVRNKSYDDLAQEALEELKIRS
jgi:hypothetical protein